MPRFIPGLAKLPEKRKITQTKKHQRDCIYDRSKRNRGISRNGRSTHGPYDDENNAMFCSSTSCCACEGGQDTAGTIVTRGNNAFATDEAGLVKYLAD